MTDTIPTVTVPRSEINALMNGLQEVINNKKAALKLLSSLDADIFAAWQAFDKALVPVVPPAEPAKPVVESAPDATNGSAN